MGLHVDLRKRVVLAYEHKEGTCRELGKRFCIGFSTVSRWVTSHRSEGRLQSKNSTGRKRILSHPSVVEQMYEQNPSLSQIEAAKRYAEQTGQTVGRKTIGRTLERLGMSRKKEPLRKRTRARGCEGKAACV